MKGNLAQEVQAVGAETAFSRPFREITHPTLGLNLRTFSRQYVAL